MYSTWHIDSRWYTPDFYSHHRYSTIFFTTASWLVSWCRRNWCKACIQEVTAFEIHSDFSLNLLSLLAVTFFQIILFRSVLNFSFLCVYLFSPAFNEMKGNYVSFFQAGCLMSLLALSTVECYCTL